MKARQTRWWGVSVGAGVLAVGALVILYCFAPGQYPFYPKCLLYSMTGFACPGCGSLRAVHALLHGEIGAAFRLNPLLITLLPGLALYGVNLYYQRQRGKSLCRALEHPVWIWIVLVAVFLFGVGRNLGFGPLAAFAQ